MDTNSKQKKIYGSLEALITHKSALKEEIEEQKLQISDLSKEIISPISKTISIIRTIYKGVKILNGLQTGFKFASIFKSIFTKK